MIAVPVDGFQTTGAIGGWVEPGVAFEHSSSNDSLKTEVIKSADDSTPVKRSSVSAHESCGCCGLRSWHGYDLHIDNVSYANKGHNYSSPISNADDGEWVEKLVLPVSSCSFKVLPSYQCRHLMEYEVANSARIPNLGERKCII